MSKKSRQGGFRQRKGRQSNWRPNCGYNGTSGDDVRQMLDDRIEKAMVDYLYEDSEGCGVVDHKTSQPEYAASGGVPVGRKIAIIGGTRK